MRDTTSKPALLVAVVAAAFALNAGAAQANIGVIGSITTSTPGTPLGNVSRMAVDQNTGDLYLADIQRNRIVKYDPSGAFIMTFGREVDATKVRKRHEEEEKGEPVTVTAEEEDVCTAISGDECQAGTEGTGPGQFQEPNRVVVSPSTGEVYVEDSQGTQEFKPNGGYVPQQTPIPRGVQAIDLEGDFYAAVEEYPNQSIHRFSSSGVDTGIKYFLGDSISQPTFAVDAEGNVYVTGSPGEAHLLKFDPFGTPLGRLGDGDTEGGLAIDLITGDVFAFPVPSGEEEFQFVEYSGSTGGQVASYPSGIPYKAYEPHPNGMAFAAKTGRLYVLKTGGSSSDEILIYGTFPVPAAKAPIVSDESVAASGLTSATVTAKVNPNLEETTYDFQYAGSASFAGAIDVPVAPVVVGSGFLPVRVSAELSGLASSTTYYYRVVAHSSFAGGTTVTGPAQRLTTLAPAPLASTEGASEVSYNAVTLAGTITPGSVGAASDTRWCFEYGTGGGGAYNLGSVPLLPGDVGQGTAGVPVSLRLTDLAPGSTYHYRLVAVNSLGLGLGSAACGTEGGHEDAGAPQTFTTPVAFPAPVAVSGGASGVSQNAATISGSVDPEGVRTSYEFQLGLDTSYGAQVFGEAGTGSELEAFSLALSQLQPDATYHYRLVAISNGGTSYGADETFTTGGFASETLSAPLAPPLLATPVFAFPTIPTTAPTHKTGKTKTKAKTKRKKKKGRRKAGKAGGPGHRAGNGRSR